MKNGSNDSSHNNSSHNNQTGDSRSSGNNENHGRKEDLLVSDAESKLPPLRSDVEMIPVTHEDKELIYFHDPQGYLPGPIALDRQIAALMPMLDGNFSVRDICSDLKRYGNDVDEMELLAFVRQLDESRLLLSPWFRECKKEIEETFEREAERPAVCAGQSYPQTESEIRELLDAAFSQNGEEQYGVSIEAGRIKALYAPHIDFRVGLSSYIPAFRRLADIRPKRVVLLATSHYSGSYFPLYDGKPFVVTRKSFETPLGVVPADQEFLDILAEQSEVAGCSFADRAHRNEHSIELHLIFLQYLWSHSFSVVPILVGSLEEMYYKEDGDIGQKVDAMASLLGEHFADDPDTLFVISGDLAHVGKKFGDPQPASTMFEDIRRFDREFLDLAISGERKALLELMRRDFDPYRICGFPPLYTAMRALSDVKGSVASYDLWDESERESAVTFGSVLFQELPKGH